MNYQGIIKDQLGTMETKKTKVYPTYQAAHKHAKKLCIKTMGDRGTIEVVEVVPVVKPVTDLHYSLYLAEKYD